MIVDPNLFEKWEERAVREESDDDEDDGSVTSGESSGHLLSESPDLVLMDDVDEDFVDIFQSDDGVNELLQGQEPDTYRGLGKRLEPFAALAKPMDEAGIRSQLEALQGYKTMVEKLEVPTGGTGGPTGGVRAQDSGPLVCRICRDSEESSPEPAVQPCDCRGSVARVHVSCLERWLAESDSSRCELCGFQYTTVRTPRYSVLTSIPAWLCNTGNTDLLFDLVAFSTFTPVALFGTYIGVNLEETAYIQVLLMAAIDLVYSAWLTLRLQYHVSRWYSWWRRKSTVKVVLPEDVRLGRLASRERRDSLGGLGGTGTGNSSKEELLSTVSSQPTGAAASPTLVEQEIAD